MLERLLRVLIDKLLDKVAVGEGRRLSELLRFHAFFHCKRYQGSVFSR